MNEVKNENPKEKISKEQHSETIQQDESNFFSSKKISK